MHDSDTPLLGITVVENARDVAAQYCGRLLATLGATVIKVEPPGGSPMRSQPPLIRQSPPAGALFEYLSLGKQSVTCELASPAGQRDFRALLAKARVLLDDTPIAERGALLSPDCVQEGFPALVHVSVLPFGAVGERAGFKARELNLQHAGGEGFLMPNGLALERFPDRPPVKIHGHFAEYVGGMSATCAVLGALYAHDEAGGQFVDVSVQDANIAVGCFAVQRLGDGVMETRHARSFKYGGVIECRDGFVQVLVLEQHQWQGLVRLMDSPAWATAAELADPLERSRRGSEINAQLRAWARSRTVQEIVTKGQAESVPISPYNEAETVLASDAVSGRANFGLAELAGGSAVPAFIAPFKFPQSPLGLGKGIGAPGADNARHFTQSAARSPAKAAANQAVPAARI